MVKVLIDFLLIETVCVLELKKKCQRAVGSLKVMKGGKVTDPSPQAVVTVYHPSPVYLLQTVTAFINDCAVAFLKKGNYSPSSHSYQSKPN